MPDYQPLFLGITSQNFSQIQKILHAEAGVDPIAFFKGVPVSRTAKVEAPWANFENYNPENTISSLTWKEGKPLKLYHIL